MSTKMTGKEARELFEKLRREFLKFYELVKRGHTERGNPDRQGHDLTHDVTVAQHALVIADTPEIGRKAWVASLLHSMDYWGGYVKGNPIQSMENHRAFAREAMEQLPQGSFSETEIAEIIDAAVRHGEKNRDDQSPVQVTLQDADRLSNLMMAVAFRNGQNCPSVPAIELEWLSERNPETTYAEPRSCLDDMRICIKEYEPQFRLPKAQTLARRYIATLENFISVVRWQHEDLGIAGMEIA